LDALAMTPSHPKLSFVIPFLNEEATLRELFEKIAQAVQPLLTKSDDFEVILVDDGSTDGSLAEAERLVLEHPQVQLLELQVIFVKSAALAAGFGAARGHMVFTLDADLQDDPKEIPRFVAKLEEGFDLVSGYKLKRNDPISKVVPSRVFNLLVRVTTGVKLHDVNCGFKAYRDVVLKNVRLYGELHRFIPVLAHWKRYRISEIPIEHHARRFGASKFGGGRFFRGLMDLLTVVFLLRYGRRPAHFFGALGMLTLSVGVALGMYLTVIWCMGQSIGHRPLLILAVLLIVVGVQILATGLIAELIVHLARTDLPYVLKREIRHEAPLRETSERLPSVIAR
jgi:glycosyltransferase involved in cell wall biosynthesis